MVSGLLNCKYSLTRFKISCMKILVYFERINLLHKLISEEKTGTPKQLAERLGISKSRLYCIMEDLKLREVPIEYCRKRRSYCYTEPFKMKASLELTRLSDSDLINVNGGGTFFMESGRIILPG